MADAAKRGMTRAGAVGLVTGLIWLFTAGLVTPALAAAGSAPPKPSLTVPSLASVSAAGCYPMQIQWTQTQNLGKVQVNVTYLDPTVILSCVKNTYPTAAAQRQQAARQVAGFPAKLRVQLRILAPQQKTLAPGNWQVSLRSAGRAGRPGGPVVTATAHSVTQAPTLVTEGTGTAYQDTMTFVIPDPGKEFLPPKSQHLVAEVSGPAGRTSVRWNFTGKAPARAKTSSNGTAGYVPILGWVIVAVGIVLLAAMWVTRPVTGQEA